MVAETSAPKTTPSIGDYLRNNIREYGLLVGTSSGATTCTSSPRVANDAATSRPIKLAPTTTARFADSAFAMIARLSARDLR